MQYLVDTYTLEYLENENKYYISFKDSVENECKIEISREIFEEYMKSKKSYIKIKNETDRHIEQSDQTEISLYKKSIMSKISVEDTVIQKLTSSELRKVVKGISEPHNHRVEMYFFGEMSIQEIAIKEDKNERTIRYSISKGIDEISKKLRNF